jgi:hypothetical protein
MMYFSRWIPMVSTNKILFLVIFIKIVCFYKFIFVLSMIILSRGSITTLTWQCLLAHTLYIHRPRLIPTRFFLIFHFYTQQTSLKGYSLWCCFGIRVWHLHTHTSFSWLLSRETRLTHTHKHHTPIFGYEAATWLLVLGGGAWHTYSMATVWPDTGTPQKLLYNSSSSFIDKPIIPQ